MYYFNVCGDANKVPEACVAVEKAVQSPAYQISHDSKYAYLSCEWYLKGRKKRKYRRDMQPCNFHNCKKHTTSGTIFSLLLSFSQS
jgi:hypothetical protein